MKSVYMYFCILKGPLKLFTENFFLEKWELCSIKDDDYPTHVTGSVSDEQPARADPQTVLVTHDELLHSELAEPRMDTSLRDGIISLTAYCTLTQSEIGLCRNGLLETGQQRLSHVWT